MFENGFDRKDAIFVIVALKALQSYTKIFGTNLPQLYTISSYIFCALKETTAKTFNSKQMGIVRRNSKPGCKKSKACRLPAFTALAAEQKIVEKVTNVHLPRIL